MRYKIQAEGDKYVLFDELGYIQEESLVGYCLQAIAAYEDITLLHCKSESQALAVLRHEGVLIKFLEEDGSEMSW